jgi:hypothetical protein
VTSGKSGGGGAYPSGRMVGRRRKTFGAATFIGGEGAPVVAGEGDELMQLRRGEGVRGLQEIAGIGSSGRSSPGSGGRRRWSIVGSSGESWVLERRSQRGVETGE